MLRMPEVAADSGDGVLAAWLIDEEARFDAAQTIAYVETDAELFSVEAGRPGLLLKTLVEPGTRVAPGTPIGILGEPWEQVQDLADVLAELGVAPRERVSASSASAAASSSWFETPPREAPEADDPLQVSLVAEASPLELDPLLSLVSDEPLPTGGAHAAPVGAAEDVEAAGSVTRPPCTTTTCAPACGSTAWSPTPPSSTAPSPGSPTS
ncbi:MAG: lipoyl domain-containing protein [Nocardioides sp.]